jgi:F420-dependent oxidoreductase-like protein
MELGLHVPDFTWPNGPGALARDLTRVATAAEDAGFAKLSVMDHVWQIGHLGPPEHEMLEAYTTLGYLAARTSRIQLLAWVTGVVYREPGLLAKMVTTLDVLSEGRAWLGIGAAWNEEESRGLGLPFPPVAERFERLEEALQICLQMWSGGDKPYEGKHYRLERTLNSPPAPSRPRPPILVGGGGERKTLRLVAQYADACNLFAGVDLEHKLDVLRGGRPGLRRDPEDRDGAARPGPERREGRRPAGRAAPVRRPRLHACAGCGPGGLHHHAAGDPGRAGDPGGRRLLTAPRPPGQPALRTGECDNLHGDGALDPSDAVDDARGALGLGTVPAAEEPATRLDAVSDHLEAAVLTYRCHPMDRTLEAVEHVHRSLGVHLKSELVVVAADLAGRHGMASFRLLRLRRGLRTLVDRLIRLVRAPAAPG